MNPIITRTHIRFNPDPKRVIARFNFYGHSNRIRAIVQKVLEMPETAAQIFMNQTLRDFAPRHKNISKIFRSHCEKLMEMQPDIKDQVHEMSEMKRLLTGSYFTSEFSLESAAFFNPSIVEDPDQTGLDFGQKRVILSFRAVGENGLSSLVFRTGIIDRENNISFQSAGNQIDEAEMKWMESFDKKPFMGKLADMKISGNLMEEVFTGLAETFTRAALLKSVAKCREKNPADFTRHKELDTILWLADSHFGISFSLDNYISERVILPLMGVETQGIEDARFVKFTGDDGIATWYATYAAHNGFAVLPKLIETRDFYHFRVTPLFGKMAQFRGMALFPRKINGRYAMLGRTDGVNNYIMFSDRIDTWNEAQLIREPQYPWELIHVGNCGSPVETPHGWLVITHGVGAMRKYSLGAMLLDLEDPTRVIGQLNEPLLSPNSDEREGLMPNVLYSCGSLISNNRLYLPYTLSDTSSSMAVVNLEELYELLVPAGLNIPEKSREQPKARILLAEDDLIQQKIVSAILKSANYDVVIAPDGIVALIQISKGDIDLILSDINMPNFDGFQTLDYMKSNHIDIPLIFLTGYISEEIERKGRTLGAVEYLRKPVDRDQLLKKLERLLKR